ncbi:MAG TPA: cell division protein FtsH, partial [Trichocoleus sp.]
MPRSRLILNGVFLLASGLLLLNILLPGFFGPAIPREPYSMFIHRVQDHEVLRASVGQEEIRYQLKGEEGQPGDVYATTPIFDLQLPTVLEQNGVEFAAVSPPKNRWFSSLLGWVIPPLIFVGIWRFFIARGGGGGPAG